MTQQYHLQVGGHSYAFRLVPVEGEPALWVPFLSILTPYARQPVHETNKSACFKNEGIFFFTDCIQQ